MNINQLLSLEKSERMSSMNGLLSDSSSISQSYFNLYTRSKELNAGISNQITFDFLNSSYYSNANSSTGLLKSTNQLGLSSHLIENFLLKNTISNSLMKNGQTSLPADFTYGLSMTNGETKQSDKNLNETKLTTCYSNGNHRMNTVKDSSLSWSNQSVNCLNNNNLVRSKNEAYKTEMDRPTSQNSLNCSVSSVETGGDYSDELITNNKRLNEFSEQRSSIRTYFNSKEIDFNDKNDSEEDRSDGRLELNNNKNLKRPPSYDQMRLIGLSGLNETIFTEYQDWAQRTYGDSAKTKTVTRKKYERIVKILNGQEPNNVENSKFRFWVKSKGFRLGTYDNDQLATNDPLQNVLYVPCIKSSVS